MQWSNLNEQMIEEFFQNSNSPSNAQISLNFTRTSRQMGSNQKPNKDISPRLQISANHHQQKPINPQTDIFAFADQQISKFDSWMNAIGNSRRNLSNKPDSQWQTIERELFKLQNQSRPPKHSSLQNIVLSKVDQLSKKIVNLSYPKPCQHCGLSERKIFQLQNHLKNLESNLQAKTSELNRITQKQIKQIGYQLSFEVENRLLHVRIDELMNKNIQLSEIIQAKNHELNKLNQEINKLHFQKSNFLSKTKALQTRAQQLQKSKSFLMSAAKNSTSHSQFNITNQAMLNKSQNQTNIDTTLIHTNQFLADKPTADDYCAWFEKLKQVYLEMYKKQEREHLKKNPELKNNERELSDFKKGNVRYEMARSCSNIARYVSKNKENFLQLISNEIGINMKIPSSFEGSNMHSGLSNKQNIKTLELLEEELKKSQKKTEGHLSEIQNLNQQLMKMKKTLLRQKEQNTRLSRQLNQLKSELQESHHQLKILRQQIFSVNQNSSSYNPSTSNADFENSSMAKKQVPCMELVKELEQNLIEVQKQLCIKSQQLKKVIYELKTHQQHQIKLSQSLKELQRLLNKQRSQKIHYFKQSLPQQFLTTACRIRPKSINQKKLPSILHEIESRVYFQKEKLSYKFDICEQTGKKSSDLIHSLSTKILTNSLFQPSHSFILSMGSIDSQYTQYFRGQNGLIWTSISQLFKLKFAQKKFLHLDLAFSVLEITNSHITDLLTSSKSNSVSIKKSKDKVIIQNCQKLTFDNQQQTKSALNQTYSKQSETNSHLITMFQLRITDKRNNLKFVSKLFFTQIGIHNFPQQDQHNQQNLTKDIKALWGVLKSKISKESFHPDSNRLTCLLSECFNDNNKNLMIMNVSPTELHREKSLQCLNYASSLKYISTQKPKSLIRYCEKTPDNSVSKLRHNSSHSLIQTPTLNPDSFEQKTRSITKHRNSSSEHTIYGIENGERKKRTISRLSIC